jgi:hypothetical protein
MGDGNFGGRSGNRAGFLRVFRSPLLIFIPPTAPRSSSSTTRGWYNRPISGRRTKWSGLSLTLRHEIKKKNIPRASRRIEREEITGCTGSRKKREVMGDTLSKIVNRSSRLATTVLSPYLSRVRRSVPLLDSITPGLRVSFWSKEC